MIVSHRHRFIFLKTQKTGGSSVELGLSQICGNEDIITPLPAEDEVLRIGLQPQNCRIPVALRRPDWWLLQLIGKRGPRAGTEFYEHMNARAVRRAITPTIFDRYLKTTIVRNPWDREVSLYFWAMRGKQTPLSFDAFIRRPVHRPERKTWEIYSIHDRNVADVVLRYERLDEDFQQLLASIGHPEGVTLPRAKGFYRPTNRDFRLFYTAETMAVVARRYAREITYFGMTFD